MARRRRGRLGDGADVARARGSSSNASARYRPAQATGDASDADRGVAAARPSRGVPPVDHADFRPRPAWHAHHCHHQQGRRPARRSRRIVVLVLREVPATIAREVMMSRSEAERRSASVQQGAGRAARCTMAGERHDIESGRRRQHGSSTWSATPSPGDRRAGPGQIGGRVDDDAARQRQAEGHVAARYALLAIGRPGGGGRREVDLDVDRILAYRVRCRPSGCSVPRASNGRTAQDGALRGQVAVVPTPTRPAVGASTSGRPSRTARAGCAYLLEHFMSGRSAGVQAWRTPQLDARSTAALCHRAADMASLFGLR